MARLKQAQEFEVPGTEGLEARDLGGNVTTAYGAELNRAEPRRQTEPVISHVVKQVFGSMWRKHVGEKA